MSSYDVLTFLETYGSSRNATGASGFRHDRPARAAAPGQPGALRLAARALYSKYIEDLGLNRII